MTKSLFTSLYDAPYLLITLPLRPPFPFPFFLINPTKHLPLPFSLAPSTNLTPSPPRLQVQSGGSFDISVTVHGPSEKPILSETAQRQGDYVFTAQSTGEYRFCFSNSQSTFTEKMVDMEIAIENESRSASLPQRAAGATPEQHSALEEVVFRLGGQLSTINRMQKYFRTRENRNFSTVRSTEGRILRFSLVEVGMMVGMAGLQVLVVRFFFQGARKGNVPLIALLF